MCAQVHVCTHIRVPHKMYELEQQALRPHFTDEAVGTTQVSGCQGTQVFDSESQELIPLCHMQCCKQSPFG